MRSIYLDYSATTPVEPSVVDAMADCYRTMIGNPSSQHQFGRRAKRAFEDAAEAVGRLLGARMNQSNADRVVLTSGGTEANNLALGGLTDAVPGRLIVSTIEHPSTLAAAAQLRRNGWQIDLLNVLQSGTIDLDHLDRLLDETKTPSLVSVMWANNETGVIQPIEAVVARCQPRNIPVHTDAVQVAGKLPINFQQLGVTSLSVAAHKFHGPCGVGALILRHAAPHNPILFGGAQQLGLRPGTESVALAVGMRTALKQWCTNQPDRFAHLQRCRDLLETQLTSSRHDCLVNGASNRLPQTLNLSFLGIDRQQLLIALDLAGVCASSGSACASGSSEPSHVLQAMGLPINRVEGAIRLSVGIPTTLTEIETAVDRILETINQL